MHDRPSKQNFMELIEKETSENYNYQQVIRNSRKGCKLLKKQEYPTAGST